MKKGMEFPIKMILLLVVAILVIYILISFKGELGKKISNITSMAKPPAESSIPRWSRKEGGLAVNPLMGLPSEFLISALHDLFVTSDLSFNCE